MKVSVGVLSVELGRSASHPLRDGPADWGLRIDSGISFEPFGQYLVMTDHQEVLLW